LKERRKFNLSRARVKFFCRECGYETGKWFGKCPNCGTWNSIQEVSTTPEKDFLPSVSPPEPLGQPSASKVSRFDSHSPEFNRVLGGGIVPGSVILLGGDPGIGKSTFLLQSAAWVGEHHGVVLYVSGEESRHQVEIRAKRLGVSSTNLLFTAETNLLVIKRYIEELEPVLVVVDSIQTVYHPELSLVPGSLGQLRECTAEFVRLAKNKDFACFLVGHVTKEGTLAGPRVIEHMVDVVLYFEGERHQDFRVLRAVKNRFGATNEVAVFTMGECGLEEVENPSALFLAERKEGVPGSVVVAAIEGTRPFLVEIQALVCPTAFGSPRRATTGVDYNRVVMIAAVLEKRVGLRLANHDIYVNVVGGLRVSEPAADLGIALALASSFRNLPVTPGTVVLGEVGLTGEVRAIGQMEGRLREAMRMGFQRCLVPERSLDLQCRFPDVELVGIRMVKDALEAGLG